MGFGKGQGLAPGPAGRFVVDLDGQTGQALQGLGAVLAGKSSPPLGDEQRVADLERPEPGRDGTRRDDLVEDLSHGGRLLVRQQPGEGH